MFPSKMDGWQQNHQIPTYWGSSHLHFQPHYPSRQVTTASARMASPSSIITSSHSQTAHVQPFAVTLSQGTPIVIFELNQARRAKVTRELEAVRGGMLFVHPQYPESDFTNRSLMLIVVVRTTYSIPRLADYRGVRILCREEGRVQRDD